MNNQEKKIIKLLLNELAFEGALKHFGETHPDIPIVHFEEIQVIGFPLQYDGAIENYVYADVKFDDEKSVFENCYRSLRTIRNNIVHANKAYRPDVPERLDELLAWAERFIESVYKTDGPFSARAKEIKSILKIESF